MQSPIAEPAANSRQRADALTNLRIVGSLRTVADRRAIEAESQARPPLAQVMGSHAVRDDVPSQSGGHRSRLLTSFRITLSSIASARIFFSFAFSSSSAFSRLASDTSMPPNFAFHL